VTRRAIFKSPPEFARFAKHRRHTLKGANAIWLFAPEFTIVLNSSVGPRAREASRPMALHILDDCHDALR
jgi:hypothetical protein